MIRDLRFNNVTAKGIVLVLLSALLLPAAAGAQLVNGTSSFGGTVVDTANNREWLDLSVTAGFTPETAMRRFGDYGWTWATNAEVHDMLDQFFISAGPDDPSFRPYPDATSSNQTYPTDRSQFLAFQELFGGTGDEERENFSEFSAGWYNDLVFDENQEGIFWNGSQYIGGPTHVNKDTDTTHANSLYGVFLVRPLAAADAPQLDWRVRIGGITTNGNQIQYSGSPTGWRNNYVQSRRLSEIGVENDYELRVTIASDPNNSLWTVGLRVNYGETLWQEMEHSVRNSNGRLMVYENGAWQTSGPQLSQGDVVSIHVISGLIEYRLNGDLVHTSSYANPRDFVVDATFKYGAATLDLSLQSGNAPPPPDTVPITSWVNATGVATTSGNTVIYSGNVSPGWGSSVNSVPLSTLGAADDYEVSWTVDLSTINSIWVAGLGVTETRSNWRDVDFAFRNSKGFLTIHESGVFVQDVGPVSVGDVLSLHVAGSQLEYKLNGTFVYSRSISGTEDFYVDTAFKVGASQLSFSLSSDGSTPPPPSGYIPITSWIGKVGGVSTFGNNISYSGSPNGWVNSVNSLPLASLGANTDYTLSWTVDNIPSDSLWVVGLGSTESGSSWRDIDVGVRNSNGWALVYVGDQFHGNLGQISAGDVVGMSVRPGNGANGCVSFGINGSFTITACPNTTDWDMQNFYIDTAFKNGAIALGGFTITNN